MTNRRFRFCEISILSPELPEGMIFYPISRILSFIVCAVIPCAAVAGDFRYVHWIDKESITIETPAVGVSAGTVLISNDASFETLFCAKKSEYHCFFSFHFAFAVPKMISPETRQWDIRGVRFELIQRNKSISVFGRRINDLMVIRCPADVTPAGNHPWLYLYSPSQGLVGFTDEDLSATYWLEGKLGFGASD